MNDFIQQHLNPYALIKVSITIILFLIVMALIKGMIRKSFANKLSRQSQVMFIKAVSFMGYTMLAIVVISQLGFSSLFHTMLGTAGITGVALGFASKTSLENIISGLLLLSDKSFRIDDLISVGGKEGRVESIDALSVKIRTYDNQRVRIPNVKILNSDVTNLYPNTERRKDFYFHVSYQTDLAQIESLLKAIAENNPYVIRQQDTYVYFSAFDETGYQIKYGVWFNKGDIVNLTNTITQDIATTFKEKSIEIPTVLLKKPASV